MSRSGSSQRSVDAVVDNLRRRQRHLKRNSRSALEAAGKQLLKAAASPSSAHVRSDFDHPQYRIDDLARASGVTVRNIRAYQERGLLHPPTRVGRTALFDSAHLARLKIITSMLERGYTSTHILEMLSAWEEGKDLADVLGLESVLVQSHGEDEPTTMSVAAARELAGGEGNLQALVAAELVQRRGTRVVVLRPKLLKAFAEMREYGMSLATLLEVHSKVVPAVDRISQILVTAGAAHVASTFETTGAPSNADVGELVQMLTRFRALAMTSVTATLASSIDRTIEELLTEYLAHVVEAKSAEDAV